MRRREIRVTQLLLNHIDRGLLAGQLVRMGAAGEPRGGGSEMDCLQKVYNVGRCLVAGFAGSVRTQQELADRCGLDISYIGQIERGQRNPTLGVIHALAKVLGVKASDLLREGNL